MPAPRIRPASHCEIQLNQCIVHPVQHSGMSVGRDDRDRVESLDLILALENGLDRLLPPRSSRGDRSRRCARPRQRGRRRCGWQPSERDPPRSPPTRAASTSGWRNSRSSSRSHRQRAQRSSASLLDGHPRSACCPPRELPDDPLRKDQAVGFHHEASCIRQVLARASREADPPAPLLAPRTHHPLVISVCSVRAAPAGVLANHGRAPTTGLRSWPLAAVVSAYAFSIDPNASATKKWVEKTPTNEAFLHLLRRNFPAAHVIHVVRDPCGVTRHTSEWRSGRSARSGRGARC